MFGNKKMYKKGLADAMQAYEGFSEKQQAALEQLRRQVASGTDAAFDGLSEDLNGIYQYLGSQEKAALYQLDKQMDLKELEDQERRLLLAVLYQLAEDEGGEVTEAQRAFIRSVQRYMEVANPQTGVDLSVVGEIDSLDVQKLFLRVVLEFFYLRDGDEITEEQEEFLSNFSVNKKQASAIEDSVSRLYNIVGAEGIAEKYGYVAEEEAAPASASDMPGAPVEPIGLLRVTFPEGCLGSIIGDLNKWRGYVMEIEDPDSSGFRALEAEVPMARMMDYETRLCSMTQGRGTFTCKFLRYEKLSLGMPVAAAGESTMQDAEGSGDEKTGQKKAPGPEAFREVVLIDWNFCIGNGEKKVFENQYIRLGADVDVRGSLIFRNCTIEILPNCKINMDLYNNGLRSPVDTCAFICRVDSKAGKSQLLFEGCTFTVTVVSREELDDDALEALDEDALMEYFMSSDETCYINIGFYRAELVNCTFRNNGFWEFYKGSAVRDSFFENTSVAVTPGGKVENSTFFSCTSLIVSFGGKIDGCKFEHMRCTNTGGSLIRMLYGGSFTNCIFDDIELRNNCFLITGEGSAPLSPEKQYVVKNCRFTNVRTSRHDRILSRVTIEKEERTSLFKKEKKEYLVEIIDKPSCTGLEDVEWLDG